MSRQRGRQTLGGTHRGIICDLDGVVYRGPTAVAGAVDALASLDVPVHFATNNASRPAAEVAAHLRELGLLVQPGDVTTSAQAGARVLSDRFPSGTEVLVVGGPGVPEAVSEVGLTPARATTGTTAAVLQGYGSSVAAGDLAEAAYAIESGATWVATNEDATLPTDRGVAPGNGMLVAAVRKAVGRNPDAVAGKPHAPLYELCAARLAAPLEEVLAVGDRLETDIEGACRLGMPSVLVLTGVHGVRDALLAPPARRPTWVVPDLSWLRRPADDTGLDRVNRALASFWSVRDAGTADDELVRDACAEIDSILGAGSTVS